MLHGSEFELLDNDTLLFRYEVFEIAGYIDSLPIICSNVSQNGTVQQIYYPPFFSVLTYVAWSFSVVGCVMVLVTYALFKELRTLPGQILMNLVAMHHSGCHCFMIGNLIVSTTENDELCETTAIILHWLVLSQFSWMSIMSFEVLRTLCRASRLNALEEKSRRNKTFLMYFLIGWGIPLILTHCYSELCK